MKCTSPAATAKQRDIHAFMLTFQVANFMPPTVREIARAFGIASTNAVNDHLRAMAKKGLVRHRPRITRGWLALPLTAEQPQQGAAA